METRQKQLLGGGLILASGALLAKETFAWALAQALDALSEVGIGSGGWAMTDFPWLDTLGIALMISGSFFLLSAVRDKRRSRLPLVSTTESPVPSGEAAGGAADVQPFNAKGLYVGEMNVATGQLADRHLLEITARCFNATNHTIFIHKVEGQIGVSEIINGSGKSIGKLPPSLLMDDKVRATDIATGAEFLIVLEQRVQREFAEKVMAIDGSKTLSLDLENLSIMAASQSDTRSSARIPLWDGIRLSRDPNRIQSGRIIVARVKPARITISG